MNTLEITDMAMIMVMVREWRGGKHENLSSCAGSLSFVLTDTDIPSPTFLRALLFRYTKYEG